MDTIKTLIIIARLNFYPIIIFSIFSSIVSVGYALSIKNEFRSFAIIAPKEKANDLNINSLIGSSAGLGSLLTGGLVNSDFDISMELLESNMFLGDFVEDKYVEILAAEGWDSKNGELIIDDRDYNLTEQKWIRKARSPWGILPSREEAVKKFKKKNFDLQIDRRNNIVTVGITSYSPELAKNWADQIIRQLDDKVRQRDLSEATEALEYLNVRLSKKDISMDVRNTLARLVQRYEQTILLANLNREYAFELIDPPFIPLQKSEPTRSIIAIGIFSFLTFPFFISLLILFNSNYKITLVKGFKPSLTKID